MSNTISARELRRLKDLEKRIDQLRWKSLHVYERFEAARKARADHDREFARLCDERDALLQGQLIFHETA